MKKMFSKLAALAMALPFVCCAAEFDSTVHFQVGTQYPEETSHIKMTGNFYDYIPDSPLMWVISPKIYLNPSVPVDFSGSVGLKAPLGDFVVGAHLFGHFHNFGDFPVNQYGHTVELLHRFFDAKLNYYYPANGVYPLSDGIISSHRLDSEFTAKIQNAAITFGPVYQFQDQKWGWLGRISMIGETADFGVEMNNAPNSTVMTSLFLTLKFPSKNLCKIQPKGNQSCHYTNLSIQGPTSYSTENETVIKVTEKEEAQ